jgi:hypothetical protein
LLSRLLVALSLLAAGCGPVVHVPLKAEDAGKIRGTLVRAIIVQDGIRAGVQPSNVSAAAGGGLLPGLIDVGVDAHRTSRANKLMEPIRKELAGYDFRAQFAEALGRTAPRLTRLKVSQATTTAAPLPAKDPVVFWKDVAEDALLTLTTNYDLSMSFNSLIVTTVATLSLRGRDEPIYRGRYLYHSPPIGAFNEPEESARAWAADGAAALRAALAESITETMKMLALDLDESGAVVVATATPKLSMWSTPGLMAFPAYLARDGNRYIVRVDGALTSASSDERFVAPAPPR